MFRGYEGGVVLSYETADGRRGTADKGSVICRQSTVRGHLSFQRIRQYYAEIEQLQREIDKIKKRLGIKDG